MRLAFDCETDGLLRDLTRIHCLVIQDLDTGLVQRFDDEPNNRYSIADGLNTLSVADEIWGHNAIGFDYEALISCYPFFRDCEAKIYDTLILSRLFFTDMLNRDFRSRPTNMPAQLYGRHSLESWGYRLGVLKSEYGKQLKGDWSIYTDEMLKYCEQDVEVSVALVKMFEPKLKEYAKPIETEHKIARIMSWQEREGFPFHVAKAHKLEDKLRKELEQLSDEMRSTFVWVDGGNFTPARPNQNKGYVTGAEFCRLKEFNPTSRQHIAFAFQNYRGWEATEKTDTGRPKIDEKILEEIGSLESKKFARILTLQKHLGQLSEGQNAWLKQVDKEGRIHHSCILNTNTGRQAHLKPNLAQVKSDHESRELFHPGPDRVQVGADASGLELRCLAHYLARYDGGAFAKEVVEGDIHSYMAAISKVDRKTQKSVTYCLIYGGGNFKLGLTAGATKARAVSRGKELRKKLLTGIKGFQELNDAIQARAQHGVINALDGRPIRLQGKNHAALNYLLQSCGAILCKSWLLRSNELLQENKIDYWPLAFVHDEMQLSVRPEHAEKACELITQAMKDVRTGFAFRCELDSEAKIGKDWSDCH
ncbi:DNA polymerase I [Cyanophage SS120-1]|uniref:DNA polymerase n=5 Tax=Viruses TaxID=10239 RepID=M1T379_9CAUD|nr:DNA polymerase I [Cyanophage SS120-1]AGG54550.1 DNA polymerase [Cyanophage SS120-1]